MSVVVNSHRSTDVGSRVAATIGGDYESADIADETQARQLVDRVVERHGRLDLLVNNAATTHSIAHADLEAVTSEVWQDILGTNVMGTWFVTAAAMPHLAQTEAGHVVNITSLGGQRPLGSSIPYAVSKAGVDHLTRLLAKACGPQVRVNAVAPGFIDTPWTSGWSELRETVVSSIPLRRAGTPDDIADAVIGLHRMRYVTGQVLAVDGGYHLV